MNRFFTIFLLTLTINIASFCYAFSATRLYYENFDDKTINSPYKGNITVEKGFWPTVYSSDYNMNAVGRGGSGYCFSGAQNVSAYLVWWFNSTWPSDEMYVSFYQRFANYTPSSNGYENFKIFYPHWDGQSSNIHVTGYSDDQINFALYGNGQYYVTNKYVSFPNQFSDPKWHHYEFWVKFSTGQIKIWYDGTLKVNETIGSGKWGRSMYYITCGSGDGNDPGKFLRQYDDWEVWDGMPGSVGTPSPVDNPPTVSISSPTQASTYQSSTDSVQLNGIASDDDGLASITWLNSNNQQGTISSNLTNWSTGTIMLNQGTNQITVTATDTSGQKSSDTLTVTYNPDTTSQLQAPTGLRIVNVTTP